MPISSEPKAMNGGNQPFGRARTSAMTTMASATSRKPVRTGRIADQPASQVRSARCFIAVSRRRVTRTCPRVRITSVL